MAHSGSGAFFGQGASKRHGQSRRRLAHGCRRLSGHHAGTRPHSNALAANDTAGIAWSNVGGNSSRRSRSSPTWAPIVCDVSRPISTPTPENSRASKIALRSSRRRLGRWRLAITRRPSPCCSTSTAPSPCFASTIKSCRCPARSRTCRWKGAKTTRRVQPDGGRSGRLVRPAALAPSMNGNCRSFTPLDI